MTSTDKAIHIIYRYIVCRRDRKSWPTIKKELATMHAIPERHVQQVVKTAQRRERYWNDHAKKEVSPNR